MLGRMIAWSAFVVWLRSYWRTSVWLVPVVVAAISVALITFAHGEYLNLVEAAQITRHVALSFALKWGLIAAVLLVTLAAILRKRRRKDDLSTSAIHSEDQSHESQLPEGVNLDRPRSAAERILDESPP